MKVRYTAPALMQIAEILDGIAAENAGAAASVANRFETLVSLVARHPAIGRQTSLADVRVIPAKPYPYLIFYRATGENLIILRVRHMARQEAWRSGR
jgi:plasmid stabilization system protein ParE